MANPNSTTDKEGNEFIEPEIGFRESVYTVDTDNNLCTCDSFVLEAHYKVYFKQGATNSYQIESFKVDIVYGSLTKDCDDDYKHTFNIKTSVTYLENVGGRKLSGSPGYLRGKPVIIGDIKKEEVVDPDSSATSLEDRI